jgi:hypothetical protein
MKAARAIPFNERLPWEAAQAWFGVRCGITSGGLSTCLMRSRACACVRRRKSSRRDPGARFRVPGPEGLAAGATAPIGRHETVAWTETAVDHGVRKREAPGLRGGLKRLKRCICRSRLRVGRRELSAWLLGWRLARCGTPGMMPRRATPKRRRPSAARRFGLRLKPPSGRLGSAWPRSRSFSPARGRRARRRAGRTPCRSTARR